MNRLSKGWQSCTCLFDDFQLGIFNAFKSFVVISVLVSAFSLWSQRVDDHSANESGSPTVVLEIFEHLHTSRQLLTIEVQDQGLGVRVSKLGVFLTGDFNSFPDQEAYLSMKDDGWLHDLHEEVPAQKRYGEDVTFTGFKPEDWQDERGRIDYIWFGPHGSSSASSGSDPWSAIGYAILPNVFDDGIYLSDHRAVVGDLQLNVT